MTRTEPETPRAGAHTLQTVDLELGYGERPILGPLDLSLPDGRVSVIIGANGSGKSTLLRGMARLLTPSRGAVLLDGRSVHRTPSKEIAKVLGLLPRGRVRRKASPSPTWSVAAAIPTRVGFGSGRRPMTMRSVRRSRPPARWSWRTGGSKT